MAAFERVYARPGARVIVLGPRDGGQALLTQYVAGNNESTLVHRQLWFEGVQDAAVCTAKWKRILQDVFFHVGVDCEDVTLVVERLELVPSRIISELLALMLSGEVPGAFSLEEQIALATRVRDERLIEMEQRYEAHLSRIRSELELQRHQEIAALERESDSAAAGSQTERAASTLELDRKFQQLLHLRLSQAQLRHQQDLDDFMRTCEVENESVTATIMSLMRPLGMTSGKWQQIVQRIRRRLRVVVHLSIESLCDIHHQVPALVASCDLVRAPCMDAQALDALLFGSFYTSVHLCARTARARSQAPKDKQPRIGVLLDHLLQELPRICAVASAMHAAAVALARERNSIVGTGFALQLVSVFSRCLEAAIDEEDAHYARLEWFLYVHSSMEKALWRLRDRDSELQAQLEASERQIQVSREVLEEQKEDCDRIRDMMKRYQDAAEDQVQITNEMETRARAELHVPMACLEEANAALLLIEKRHIVEIKSFNSPPLLVHLVLDAICVMFRLEPTWENARKLLGDANVVNTLLSYDKDNISSDIIAKLEATYVNDPRFVREEVEKQSVAASMMVVWVRAMYQYATARRQVKPTLDKLEQAQGRLRLLMQEFQTSKQRVVEADEALAKTRETLSQAEALRKETVIELDSRHSRVDCGRGLLETLEHEKHLVLAQLQQLEAELTHGLVWWNALMTSGFIVYARMYDEQDRQRLVESWTQLINAKVTPSDPSSRTLQSVWSPTALLHMPPPSGDTDPAHSDIGSSICRDATDRLRGWQIASVCGVAFSARSFQDACWLSHVVQAGFRVFMLTELAMETEHLLLKLSRHRWKWTQFYLVSARDADIDSIVMAALKEGHQLFILDVEPMDLEPGQGILHALYTWKTSVDDGKEKLRVDKPRADGVDTFQRIEIHSAFRAILSSYLPADCFGECLATQCPLLQAGYAPCEVAGVLLDSMWFPGNFHGHQYFALKPNIREYERLRRQLDASLSELVKQMQTAAVRGEFQAEETNAMLATSTKCRQLRETMECKRSEIHESVKHVEKHQSMARLGAAIFNAFHSREGDTDHKPFMCELSLQQYVPMFLAAIKEAPNPVATIPTNQPVPPVLARQVSGARQSSRSLLSAGPSSSRAMSIRAAYFESTAAILQTILNRLMPFIRDEDAWYSFVMQMLWLVETPPSNGGGTLPETASRANKDASATENTLLNVDIRQALAALKLHSILQRDDVVRMSQLDPAQWIQYVVNGQTGLSVSDDRLAASLDIGSTRSRRLQIALAADPHLFKAISDRVLQAYGVHVQFNRCQTLSTSSPARPAETDRDHDTAASSRLLELIQHLPGEASLVLQSSYPWDTFAWLHDVFNLTTSSEQHRLSILKSATARSFRSADDIHRLYVVPNHRLLQGSAVGHHRGPDSGNNVLMLRRFDQFVAMEPDRREAFLDDVPLVLVCMHPLEPATPVHGQWWEELVHLNNPSPQRTTSVVLRRFDASAHSARQQVSTTKDSGSRIRGETMRRLSTYQADRRTSELALLAIPPSVPRVIAVVQGSLPFSVPHHLRSTLRRLETGTGGDAQRLSFARCVQETLVRLAYHPCTEFINQIIAQSEESTKAPRASIVATAPTHTTLDRDSVITASLPTKGLWHYLAVLVVYHALLLHRRELLVQFSTSAAIANVPIEHYGHDVLITAVNQVMLFFLQAKPTRQSASSGSQSTTRGLHDRIRSQAVLASYVRQARSRYERIILKRLSKEAFLLVEEAAVERSNSTAASSLPTSRQNSSVAREPNDVTGASVRSLVSHRALNTGSSSKAFSSTALGLASSRRVFRRRSSSTDQTLSLLTQLLVPLDRISDSVHDLETWLDVMWTYATAVEPGIESHARDLFNLPWSDASSPPPLAWDTTASAALSMEHFGWRRSHGAPQPAHTILTDVSLEDASLLVRQLIDRCESTSCSLASRLCHRDKHDDQTASHLEDQTTVSPRSIERQCRLELTKALDALLSRSRRFFLELSRELCDRLAVNGETTRPLTIASVASVDVRRRVTALLSNEIPVDLWRSILPMRTCGLASAEAISLHALFSHYQRWLDALDDSERSPPSWWLPALPVCWSIQLLVDAARDRFAAARGITTEHCELSWSLHMATRPTSSAHSFGVGEVQDDEEEEERDDDQDTMEEAHVAGDQDEFTEDTIVAFSGLLLHSVLWDQEREYLQPFGRDTKARSPQRVVLLCHAEERRSPVAAPPPPQSATPHLAQLQRPRRRVHHATRSCPLLIDGRVVLDVDLPVGPAVTSLISPFLTAALS
ncbi:hypothetical protein P43SY_004868 [Pythium insidiosum]|uniref:Dynein heavy chain coiled coil stalk domain-containing protein n=1 Tax=Pythium insidiosum TaxID=114742 RepID=A0AAD5L8T2_PYTIN|nr:hypothetical protein P43SY_004868 [Pythium insidiosum]